MRVASVLPLALALGPVAVSAKAGLLGFALGTKRNDGSCKETADYETDLKVLSSKSHYIRGYDASDCNFAEKVLPAAAKADFQVVLGIWPDTDDSYKKGLDAVTTFAPKYKDNVHAITVGSETLYRRSLTGEGLASKITEVKKALNNDFSVGTADVWNNLTESYANPAIQASDLVLANAFPYWQGQAIKNASSSFFDSIGRAIGHIQEVKGSLDFEIWVGETGWPTGGTNYQDAEPGVGNARTFFKDGICPMIKYGTNVFAFEAFDETWKPVSKGDNGESKDETHWGVFESSQSAQPKFDLSC